MSASSGPTRIQAIFNGENFPSASARLPYLSTGGGTVLGAINAEAGLNTDTIRPRASASTNLAVTTTGAVNYAGSRVNFNGGTANAIIHTGNVCTITASSQNVLTINGATQRVGVNQTNPGSALDISGVAMCNQIRASSNITDAQTLSQGMWMGWNHGGATGEGQLVVKSGSGSGGLRIFDSQGDGSSFSTNRVELAFLSRTAGMTIPGPMYAQGLYWKGTATNFSTLGDGSGVINLLIANGTVTNRFPTNPWSGTWFPPYNHAIYRVELVARFQDGAGTYSIEPRINNVAVYPDRIWVPVDSGNRRSICYADTIHILGAHSYNILLYVGNINCIYASLTISLVGMN